MKKNILKALVLSLVTAAAANASIVITFENGNTAHASKSVSLSSLNGPLSFSQTGMAGSSASGTVATPPIIGSGETIDIVWTAANDWNSTIAAASFGDFSTYAAGLSAVNVQCDGGKMGVVSGAVADKVINANDVMVMTVDTSALISGTLQIEAMDLFAVNGDDSVDYVIYDASADSVVFSSFGTAGNLSSFLLDNGDQVYVAGSTGMTGDGFAMGKTYTLDVVPEPASIALVGFASVVLLALRRFRI